MARLDLSTPRSIDTRAEHIGKTLLFCEGYTEINYFTYFADIIEKNKDNYKYSDIDIVPINAQGNALAVLNEANKYLKENGNAQKYEHYEKCLIFDCDSPKDIQKAISLMLDEKIYTLFPTNLLFETWLLLHYQPLDVPIKKRKTLQMFEASLGITKYSKRKNDKKLTASIIGNGDKVRIAINNAELLRKKHFPSGICDQDCDLVSEIARLNPYTKVDILVKRILDEVSDYL